mmetsp:Transcript_35649/g.95533  ORF Transcript_35649/g.95533 Transcript_35649/m.95533 type:complete len:329 (+) Transcript_35649:409-1395(+)
MPPASPMQFQLSPRRARPGLPSSAATMRCTPASPMKFPLSSSSTREVFRSSALARLTAPAAASAECSSDSAASGGLSCSDARTFCSTGGFASNACSSLGPQMAAVPFGSGGGSLACVLPLPRRPPLGERPLAPLFRRDPGERRELAGESGPPENWLRRPGDRSPRALARGEPPRELAVGEPPRALTRAPPAGAGERDTLVRRRPLLRFWTTSCTPRGSRLFLGLSPRRLAGAAAFLRSSATRPRARRPRATRWICTAASCLRCPSARAASARLRPCRPRAAFWIVVAARVSLRYCSRVRARCAATRSTSASIAASSSMSVVLRRHAVK